MKVAAIVLSFLLCSQGWATPHKDAEYHTPTGVIGNVDNVVNLLQYGAQPDAQQITGATVSGLTVTSGGTPPFAAGDVGKLMSNNGVESTIATFISATQVTTTADISGGCTSSCRIFWGTDNTAAFNAATALALQTNSALGYTFYLPAGAYGFAGTSPLVIPNGSSFRGADQSNTVLWNLAGSAVTSHFLNIGASSGGTGGTTGVYSLGFQSPFASVCDVDVATATNWVIEDNFFLSGAFGICANGTVGLIWGNNFDSNIFNGIQMTGNGVDEGGDLHSIVIGHNLFFGSRVESIGLSGVADIQITANDFMFCLVSCIAGNTTLENTRIHITDNNFVTSSNPSFYTSGQVQVSFAGGGSGGLTDSIIGHNIFSYSRAGDISLTGTTTNGDIIEDNQFVSSSLSSTSGSPDASIFIDGIGNRTIIRNNHWHNPGGYAVQLISSSAKVTGNDVLGAFTLSGIPSTADQSGAIYASEISALDQTFRDNSTTDTTYPIVSIAGPTVVNSSDNMSGFSSDVILGSSGIAPMITSINERISGTFSTASVHFGGGLNTAVFTVSALPGPGTLPAGTQLIVSDATTFTPGTCTGGGSDYMIAVTNGTTWSCH